MATGEKWREWYLANRERYNAYQRAYWQKRREPFKKPLLGPEERHRRKLERTRAWRVANALYVKAGHAAINANKRAARLGITDRLSASDVYDLWQRQPACVQCGEGIGVDHIVNMRDGGPNRPENLQTLCIGCNSRKDNLTRGPGQRRGRNSGVRAG